MPPEHDPKQHAARMRFYEELNDFLPPERKKRVFEYRFRGSPGIRDAVEALGVPHPEIDLIIVNGSSVGFEYRLQDGDEVSVYPVFESLDISPLVRLRPKPLRNTRFILDVHLGKLARALRLLGFDSAYDRQADDPDIIQQALADKRIILTRDISLLKSKRVTHGYWVRHTDPKRQLREVLKRFDLREQLRPFTRCTVCNGRIRPADPAEAKKEAPEKVRQWCEQYFRCESCGRLYWKGSHFNRLEDFVDEVNS